MPALFPWQTSGSHALDLAADEEEATPPHIIAPARAGKNDRAGQTTLRLQGRASLQPGGADSRRRAGRSSKARQGVRP